MTQMRANMVQAPQMPHLGPALVAVLLAILTMAAGVGYARLAEAEYVHVLAPEIFEHKNVGSALQAAAFREPDLLPLYGSSEMRVADRYHAGTVFRDYPTGFTVFPIGKPGTTCLVMLQDLAAVGSAVHGKKVALSLTPSWFCEGGSVDAAAYAGNFSRLHAAELVFSSELSLSLKHAVARRMLAYPAPLTQAPLLRLAVEQLADGSWGSQWLYYFLLPLGKLQTGLLRLQDHWETLAFVHQQPFLDPTVGREEAHLDWKEVLPEAERDYRKQATNNPFGFYNPRWLNRFQGEAERQKGTRTDETFLHTVEHAQEWTDLDLLLKVLRELGAEPLLLSMPIHGGYYDHWGISHEAREVFYNRFAQATQDLSTAAFSNHDYDKYFLIDHGHLSSKGWVYYDQALDAFFHAQPPAPLPASETQYGHHDRADCDWVTGWAWDSERPNDPLAVDIYADDKLLATVLANQFRSDLLHTGRGNGRHGFAFSMPVALKDGSRHVIRVRVAGSATDLRNTPQDFSCLRR
jgi:D-alanine transfer protein